MSDRAHLAKLLDCLRALKRQRRRSHLPLKKLGTLVSGLVRCPSGSLQQDLSDLWAYLGPTKHPIAAAFTPKRSSSITQIARLWWLQLLVMIAQAFGPRRWVVPRDLDAQAGRVQQAIDAAQGAWRKYSTQHGSAVLDHLVEAIEYLLATVPEGLSLDGQHVVIDGAKIAEPLTPKERDLLALLIQADGQTVPYACFQGKTPRRVHQIKSRLVAKSEFAGLEYLIAVDSGSGYRLICKAP